MSQSVNTYDVIVLGAGAAGLFSAITAAKRNKKVLVIEKSNKAGKKILMSGGGKCNFTNHFVDPDNFISKNEHFCKSALSDYSDFDGLSPEDRDALIKEIGTYAFNFRRRLMIDGYFGSQFQDIIKNTNILKYSF